MTIDTASVAADLAGYDGHGHHRTGTAGDESCARWLAEAASTAGLETRLVAFDLERVDPIAGSVRAGDRVAEGLTLFDGGVTPDGGVTGSAGPAGSSAPIGVAQAPCFWGRPGTLDAMRAREDGCHRAMVVVSGGEPFGLRAGLTLLNAERFLRPLPTPVLQVASEHAPWLLAATGEGRALTVTVRATRSRATARNVEARLAGREPDLPPLVVMTPRSGWWHCASERGPGIACWLAIARALAAARPRREVRMVATSGHELGHLGLDHFLHANPGLVAGAHAWIHLGANFGGAVGARLEVQGSDDAWATRAVDALAGVGVVPDGVRAGDAAPRGEAANLVAEGGRFVSLVGDNALFHHPHDRGLEVVDLDRTARVARAMASVACALAG
ncbi:MAG: hypothetical protein H6983_04545 [Ectothiorhodospiraceae bacterium]|nr:hypothetical protein [Ectothiorhodospiraceae bacterium]